MVLPAAILTLSIALAATACGESASSQPRATDSDDDERARTRGAALFAGRGGCLECHRRGDLGDKSRGPDLGSGGPRAAADVAIAIVDPDAEVGADYAAGVMKPPDEPPRNLGDDDIADLAMYLADHGTRASARAAIGPARATRTTRRAQARIDATVRRVPWHRADVTRGEALFEQLGCALCHGNAHLADLNAPPLTNVGARLSRDDLARWLLAPPQTNMPSYAQAAPLTDIADVCEYVRTRR